MSVSDGLTKKRIKKTWIDHKIPVEQHGATSLEAAYRYRDVTGDRAPILVTETAAPWKFPATLEELNVDYDVPEWVIKMGELPRFKKNLPGNYEAIKEDFRATFC
jgi:threonine synthase